MKKAFPFVAGAVVLVLLVVMMTSNATRPPRYFDERITLRQSDKIPYGTRVARELLPALFPEAVIRQEKAAAGHWDSVNTQRSNQAVILIADYFDADKEELQTMADFVDGGNYVFIISRAASDDAGSFFNLSFNNDYASNFYAETLDSLRVKLEPPVFTETNLFIYPGRRYEGVLRVNDSSRTAVLGRNEKGAVNFVRLNKGRGCFFVHSAPLAFSNYFILHKGNAVYYEQALSALPKNLQTVVWNEYYLQKSGDKKGPNWLGALLSYPSFKWGLLIGVFTLALFILLGMRRRQRMIPVYQKPKNDSLDFIKTLGRLYYDRRDHKNLATKMSAYFLEYIRSHYKLPTHTLDEDFAKALHYKSGYPQSDIQEILGTIQYIGSINFIPETELSQFHRQLELFYQNT